MRVDLLDSIGFYRISIGLLLDAYWNLSDSIGFFWNSVGFQWILRDDIRLFRNRLIYLIVIGLLFESI